MPADGCARLSSVGHTLDTSRLPPGLYGALALYPGDKEERSLKSASAPIRRIKSFAEGRQPVAAARGRGPQAAGCARA